MSIVAGPIAAKLRGLLRPTTDVSIKLRIGSLSHIATVVRTNARMAFLEKLMLSPSSLASRATSIFSEATTKLSGGGTSVDDAEHDKEMDNLGDDCDLTGS
jgi:hypothetical protein